MKNVFVKKYLSLFLSLLMYITKYIVALHWIFLRSKVCRDSNTFNWGITDEWGYIYVQDLWIYLILSSEKIIEAAFKSTGRRENSLWAAVRKLLFTASNFGQIIEAIRRKGNTPKDVNRIFWTQVRCGAIYVLFISTALK